MLRFLRWFTLLLSMLVVLVIWQHSQLALLALTRIDPVPETKALMMDGRFAEAAEYLEFFLNYEYVLSDPTALALNEEIATTRASLAYQAEKVTEGLLEGTSDESLGQISGVVSDLLVIGDIRDLVLQGGHWVWGDSVDQVIVALSTIGLFATAGQVASTVATVGTAGAAAPSVVVSSMIKSSVTMLKQACRVGHLPAWLSESLISGAKTVRKTGSIDSVAEILENVRRLATVRGGLSLLSGTRNAESLFRLAQAGETFGGATRTLFRLGGETFLVSARRAPSAQSAETVRLAATYGPNGLRLLDRVGPARFVKYSARGTKIAYKGEVVQKVARLLVHLPHSVLYGMLILAVTLWLPWRRMLRRSLTG
ncbi:hypothetical protein [Thiocapsa marina]|uniref:Uncharacterized protein n=1 Tax=Thiocapsa marina 5811 TaxID=768671 RepID=F9UH43_9GAMM|nr:hypothetical protein [Thiocapsa marina]EGV16447.1 hypothetical protein ThimaDRAFT_4216 [Thiocapsa marina 5811]